MFFRVLERREMELLDIVAVMMGGGGGGGAGPYFWVAMVSWCSVRM